MERHILRERTPSCPYLIPGARGYQRLHHLAIRIVRDDTNASDRLSIPGSTLDSDRTDCLNLTAWFSYHVVSFWLHTCSAGLPRRTAISLFTNQNVTACQSTRGHQERTQNPCQQIFYNTTPFGLFNAESSHIDESLFVLRSSYLQISIHGLHFIL